jgi:hypothetical protein
VESSSATDFENGPATADRRSFGAVTEAFLVQHLGVRRQPIGDDFDGSTITVKAGRDLIPSED